MGNIIIQGVWTLYGALLILNSLDANGQTTVSERHWIVEVTAELNQPIFIRNALTLQ